MLLPANVTLRDSIKQSSNQGRVDLAHFVNAPCPSKLLIAVLPSSTTSTVSSFDRPQVIAVHSSHFQHSVFSVFFPNLWTFFVPFLGINHKTFKLLKDIQKVLLLLLQLFLFSKQRGIWCERHHHCNYMYHTITIAITALMTTMIIIIVVIQPCSELSSAAYTVSSELK